MLTKRQKSVVVKEYAVRDKDTGSAAVQIALLTRRVIELTAHLKKHPKDHHSRRGLLIMVGKRRRFLKYLEREDEKAYARLVKKLGL